MSEDLFAGSSAADTGRGGQILPEGVYPELRLVKTSIFKAKKVPYARCFSASLEVLVPANGAQAGQIGDVFEQLEFNKFESYDKEARGRVRFFLGVLFGLTNPSEIDQKVGAKELEILTSPAQPMTGTVVSARVTHRTTANGKVIAKWEFSPVLENGVVKVVRGKVEGQAPASSTQSVAQAQQPLPPPPPPPAAAAPAIPPGWAAHPQAPGWIYELANPANMKQVA